jgi:hypothetical protein
MKRLLCSAFLACLAIAGPGAAQGIPPTDIATGAAEPAETSAVVLGYFNYGSTNPPGIATRCWFEYGTTGAFGGHVDAICSGTTRATLAPLAPGTYYYYRAVASNDAGTTWGPTKSFTTLATPPPPVPGPPQQPPAVTVKLAAGQSLASVRRRGLLLRLNVAEPCPCVVRAKLVPSPGAVKRLGTTLAVLRREYQAASVSELALKLKSRSKRKLRRSRLLKATLRVTATDAAGRRTLVTRRLRLKRR